MYILFICDDSTKIYECHDFEFATSENSSFHLIMIFI